MTSAVSGIAMSMSCHTDRRKDKIYNMLTKKPDQNLLKMLKAVKQLVKDHSTHPDVDYVFTQAEHDPCVARAILLYAIANEPDFTTYILEQTDVDAPCVSEFMFKIVVPFAEEVMNGRMSLEYFVNSCLLEYTTM